MQYTLTTELPTDAIVDCLVVAIFEQQKMSTMATLINDVSEQKIQHYIDSGDFTGKIGETQLFYNLPGIKSPRVLVVGCGEQGKLTPSQYATLINHTSNTLTSTSSHTAIVYFNDIKLENYQYTWLVQQATVAFSEKKYTYTATKESQSVEHSIEQLYFACEAITPELETAIAYGQATANGMGLTKDLANLPGNICTPSYLAEQAQQLSKQYDKIETTILEEDEMAKLGMGSLLSVSKGSREPAKLITMDYRGGVSGDKPIVLVGKGLTFDAGGISLKPAAAMDEMKYDMCGAASVFGVISAIAELQLPLNVMGIVPSSENMPDGQANKPGDIVTSMAGKTIEILNTDAEGRLILCDALTYCRQFDPEIVIDIATLTGAIIVALGSKTTGLLANNQTLADDLLRAGQESEDKAWQLPLWDDYQSQLDSNFADIANIGGREAGSITAACFLSRFTEGLTWAHLDIAGTAWRSGGKNKGATGRPVPLLMHFLRHHLDKKAT